MRVVLTVFVGAATVTIFGSGKGHGRGRPVETVRGTCGAGRTAVYAGWRGQVRGLLGVAATLEDDGADVVGQLRAIGLQVAMITGDDARTAAAVAQQVGIDRPRRPRRAGCDSHVMRGCLSVGSRGPPQGGVRDIPDGGAVALAHS